MAYQQTEQWLTGATEPSGYQLNGSVYTVQLTKNGQNDLIVWNSAGQSSYAAGPYTQYVDAQGQVHTIVNGTVTIGTIPVLLETPVQNSPVPTVASVATSGIGITNGNGDLNAGQRRHADAQHERSGDGCGGNANADAQRWRHGNLHRRLRRWQRSLSATP